MSGSIFEISHYGTNDITFRRIMKYNTNEEEEYHARGATKKKSITPRAQRNLSLRSPREILKKKSSRHGRNEEEEFTPRAQRRRGVSRHGRNEFFTVTGQH